MSQYKDVEVGSTVYFWFAANQTTGAAGDGATPLYDVRAAGGAAGDAPTASGTPTLLTHANYTDGLHEIAIDTTGYAAGEYAVFCTLTISTVNPAGFCGSFRVVAVGDSLHSAAARVMDGVTLAADQAVNVTKWGGTAVASAYVQANAAQFAGQTITCSGGVTIPAATLASTTNITAASGVTLTATTGLGNQTANITGNLSGSVGSVTAGVTVTTNNDKIGYSLTQTFPTNFADLNITATTGLVRPDMANASGNYGGTVATVTTLTNAPSGMALEATLTAIKGATWSASTDTLEAIRDRGDAAWITATGFSTHSAADVKTAIEAAGSHLALILADTGTDGVAIAAAAMNAIADALLGRNVAGGSSTGRTVAQALAKLRNKWAISGSTLTIYDTDDTTPLWTETIVSNAAAEPITSSDPA